MTAAVWSWPGLGLARDRTGNSTDPCDDCGLPHTQERRLAILRRCEGMTRDEIAAAYPHIWPSADRHNTAGARMLSRDLAALHRGRR